MFCRSCVVLAMLAVGLAGGCKTGSWKRGASASAAAPILPLPARPSGAPSGSTLAGALAGLPIEERERRLVEQVLAGNVPTHVRRLEEVRVEATIDGVRRTLSYWVTPDYLAVGSSDDFLRIPLRAGTAQRLADHLGCILPTRKMVDDIHHAAVVRLTPRPFHPREHDITNLEVFEASHRAIEDQRRGRAGLVSGIKKDIVISERLARRPGRVAIYGWHRANGAAIQPLSTVHHDAYVDYSHGVRFVWREARLDGLRSDLPVLLADPALCPLVSDEGPTGSWRYR